MKSRLEEIKDNHEFRKGEGWELTTLTEDIDWLIEQAEKVEELEEQLRFQQATSVGIESIERYTNQIKDENKRLRKAMKDIYGQYDYLSIVVAKRIAKQILDEIE